MSATRILLVEDSSSDAALLQESLLETRLAEFDFTHVETWSEGLRCATAAAVRHPAARSVAAGHLGPGNVCAGAGQAPHLPIVVLTGQANEADGLEAVRQGIQDYLVKGQADARQIVRVIRYAIERKRVEDALKHTEDALRDSERQLIQANQDLEKRVAERTASLEETINDLEDFSHSITHDLRAPCGPSVPLPKSCAPSAGECGRDRSQEYIDRIVTAAARMDKLIQDVLQYSRVARTQMRLVAVDVERLLQGIIETYPAFQPPEVDIRIQGPAARAGQRGGPDAVLFQPAGQRDQVRRPGHPASGADLGGSQGKPEGRRGRGA